MAITNQRATPKKSKRKYKSLVLNFNDSTTIAGTFNGTGYSAVALTLTVSDRWRFRTYSSSGTLTRVAQWNFALPGDYVAGTDLKITFYWTTLATTATANWIVGLTKLTSTNVTGDETETEYQTFAEEFTISATYKALKSQTLTYSGVSIEESDPLVLIIARNDGVDNLNADAYLNLVYIEYLSESYEDYTNTQNILMTPTETKNIIKTVHLSTKSLSSLTGTFNSISSLSTSSNPQDLERFQAWDLDNANIMAIQGVTLLPYDYVSGTPIEVEIHYYGESGLAGNIIFGVGLCGDVSGNDWGNEADTQYSSATYAFGGAIDTEYSFSVSLTPVNTLNPYDPICIIIYRNAANAGDTYIADVQITKVSLKYTSNNI